MGDRVVGSWTRCVRAHPRGGKENGPRNLFGGRDADVFYFSLIVLVDRTAFIQRELAGDFIPVLLDQESNSRPAQTLFIRFGEENDIAVERDVLPVQEKKDLEERRDHRFVVRRA